MGNKSGGEKDRGTGGKPYDNLEVPQYEMASLVGVERAQGCDGAPATCVVAVIDVREREGSRSHVDCGGGKNCFWRGRTKVGMVSQESRCRIFVFHIGFMGKGVEHT